MLKIFNKRKRYAVAIITDNDVDFVETIATNKEEAMQIVSEVLLKCKIFGFKSNDEFQLKCKRIKRWCANG